MTGGQCRDGMYFKVKFETFQLIYIKTTTI